MNKKCIVVFPGSQWQVPIVKKIKGMGHKVLVINPYENSPAFEYADGYLQADIFDKSQVLKYCKAEHVDGIISEECDIAMPSLAEYAHELGLIAMSSKSAHLFTDKYEMREFCKMNKIAYPEYRLCKTKDEAIDFFNSNSCKMIIKPLDGNSSRGVFTVSGICDIQEHFEEALSFSRVEKAVILERYIDGVEFTVDGVKTPQKHYSLAVSEKKHFAHNKNIASELYFTHSNNFYDYDLLKQTNDLFVNLSGLEFGLTHAEYKYEDGVFYLIEIAARGGGNLISSHIVPFMSGFDNYEYLINCCLGDITSPIVKINGGDLQRAAALKFFETPSRGGRVKEIVGLEHLNNKDVVTYKFNFKVGDYIDLAKNDSSRIGFYIVCSETREQLDQVIKDIESNMQIILEN